MPIKILMPALSPTMTEGTLASWQKKEGDEVTAGDVIAEIETDKATMEVEAVDEGVMGKILVGEGSEGVKVNAAIALLLEEDEDASALDALRTVAHHEPPCQSRIRPTRDAVAIAIPASPYRRSAMIVASALAVMLTKLLPSRIRPMRRSERSSSRDARMAPR